MMFRPVRWANDPATTYLCLQKIYSPRHSQGKPPRPETVSEARPLRVVFFDEVPEPGKNPVYDAWLAEIHRDHELRDTRTFRVSPVHGPPR